MNCKKNINNPSSGYPTSHKGSSAGVSTNNIYESAEKDNLSNKTQYRYACPHCGTPFPRCAICLMPLGTSNLPFIINGVDHDQGEKDSERRDVSGSYSNDEASIFEQSIDLAESKNIQRRRKLNLNEWFSFCLSCNHGMHSGHSDEWFAKHSMCPTPGCSCQCNK